MPRYQSLSNVFCQLILNPLQIQTNPVLEPRATSELNSSYSFFGGFLQGVPPTPLKNMWKLFRKKQRPRALSSHLGDIYKDKDKVPVEQSNLKKPVGEAQNPKIKGGFLWKLTKWFSGISAIWKNEQASWSILDRGVQVPVYISVPKQVEESWALDGCRGLSLSNIKTHWKTTWI